jgi:hypothetical protein
LIWFKTSTESVGRGRKSRDQKSEVSRSKAEPWAARPEIASRQTGRRGDQLIKDEWPERSGTGGRAEDGLRASRLPSSQLDRNQGTVDGR